LVNNSPLYANTEYKRALMGIMVYFDKFNLWTFDNT